jgi:hypothetical protein
MQSHMHKALYTYFKNNFDCNLLPLSSELCKYPYQKSPVHNLGHAPKPSALWEGCGGHQDLKLTSFW